MDPGGHCGQRSGQAVGALSGLLEQVKGQPLSCFLADPREAGELGHQLVYGAHRPQSAVRGFWGSFLISA